MTQPVKATDVYGITRELPMNYVTRSAVDDELVAALSRDQHLVIYGSSKQGKTSVRKYHLRPNEYIVVTCSNRWTLGTLHSAILKQAGYTVTQSETKTATGTNKISASASIAAKLLGKGVEGSLEAGHERSKATEKVETRLELDPFDVNDIITALTEIDFRGWIVLEDFHYLPEETQKDFAVALKAFHETSSLTFIIVGVWLQENRIVQFNGDLSGRVSTINADVWHEEELREAIRVGEQHLNVEFSDGFVSSLVSSCFDNIYVVQEVCLQACLKAGVTHRGDRVIQIDEPRDAGLLIAEVVDKQSARFGDFLTNFATGFGQTSLEMYRYLLVPVITSQASELEGGLHYRTIRRRLARVHPQGANLNAGNVTQALKGVARLQVQQGVKPLVLDYDQSLKRLNVVDRSFLLWLGQQDRAELLEMIDIPSEKMASILSGGPEEEEEEE